MQWTLNFLVLLPFNYLERVKNLSLEKSNMFTEIQVKED